MIETIAKFELLLSTVLVWLFVLSYQLLAAWRATPAGKLLMASNTVFGVVLLLSAVRTLAPQASGWPWYDVVSTLVFAGVPLVFAAQLVLLYVRQFRYRYDEGAGDDRRDPRAAGPDRVPDRSTGT